MSVKKYKPEASDHNFIGTWHIYEMENWDEDYFNMEVQAYIKIKPDNLGDFQFGLVSGSLNGYIEHTDEDKERFAFNWEGVDEMDEVSGSGWLELVDNDEIQGLFDLYLGDRSTFKARKADMIVEED